MGVAPFRMTQLSAIGISIGSLVVSWAVYDLLWKFVGPRAPKVALAVSLVLLVSMIHSYAKLFPGARRSFMSARC